jgi:tetratricopeptide (TPR) repeat protein
VNVGCLDENTVAALAEARLSPEDRGRAEAHARSCVACHQAVTTAFSRSEIASKDATARLGPGGARSRLPALAAGATVGRYTVLGLVGRGGMGEVYAAYDPGLDRRVALKLMSARETARDDKAQERLTREAQAIAKLSHPNVVVVHDVGTFDGQVFVAMEFVDGVTLSAWLVASPRGWREVLEMFVQAARGLGAAHDAGLVHRDFKPQNVMVGRDGTARVMDFGLARRIDEPDLARGPAGPSRPPLDPTLTRTGELLGTPLYMAPEQFAESRIDARTDQFSFCVALYWALCGVHPFGGSSRAELSSNVQRGDVAGPKRIPAPSRIQKTLLRGLSADPKARWPSMNALIDELLRDPRRRARRLIGAAGVVGLCGVVAVAAVHLSRRGHAVCASGPDRMTGVWEPASRAGPHSRREQVRAAVLKSGTAEAPRVWEQLAAVLDRHAANWLAAYRDACEATHVRGEQSEDVLDLRMTCLADNLDSTRVFTELVSSGDRAVIDHAGETAGSLDDLASCGAAEQARSIPRPPRDPLIRRAVDDANRQIKEGKTLRLAGEAVRASAIADGILARSDVASYCPLQAEALLLKAMAMIDRAEDRGVSLFERAVETAERCGHDRVVASGLASMGFFHRFTDLPAAERELGLAAAAAARVGSDPLIESWVVNNVAALRVEQGRFEEALVDMKRSLALKRQVLDPDNFDVANSFSNVADVLTRLGRFEEALSLAQEALRIYRTWNRFTAHVALALNNEAAALKGLHRFAEAEASYKAAVDLLETDAPADHPDLWEALLGIAAVRVDRDDPAGAIPLAERVLSEQVARKALATDLAATRFQLAVALDHAHRDPARAHDLASQALDAYAAQPTFAPQRREVRAWLDERKVRL